MAKNEEGKDPVTSILAGGAPASGTDGVNTSAAAELAGAAATGAEPVPAAPEGTPIPTPPGDLAPVAVPTSETGGKERKARGGRGVKSPTGKRRSRDELVNYSQELERKLLDKEAELTRAQQQVAAQVMTDPDAISKALAPTFTTVGQLAAATWGPECDLRPGEAEALAKAWAPVVQQYMPLAAAHAPLTGALFLTASLVLPRYMAVQQRQRQNALGTGQVVVSGERVT